MERPPIEKFAQEAQDIYNSMNFDEYIWRVGIVSYLKTSIEHITHMASYIKELERQIDMWERCDDDRWK